MQQSSDAAVGVLEATGGMLDWDSTLKCGMQVLSDDVAPELPGGPGVCDPAEQLHAVLYLPHAHPLYHHGVCSIGPGP